MPNDDEEICDESTCFCTFFFSIIIFIFLISSLSFVDSNNYGLVCNWITKLCDTNDGKILKYSLKKWY
jgi:hypothetical protein